MLKRFVQNNIFNLELKTSTVHSVDFKLYLLCLKAKKLVVNLLHDPSNFNFFAFEKVDRFNEQNISENILNSGKDRSGYCSAMHSIDSSLVEHQLWYCKSIQHDEQSFEAHSLKRNGLRCTR